MPLLWSEGCSSHMTQPHDTSPCLLLLCFFCTLFLKMVNAVWCISTVQCCSWSLLCKYIYDVWSGCRCGRGAWWWSVRLLVQTILLVLVLKNIQSIPQALTSSLRTTNVKYRQYNTSVILNKNMPLCQIFRGIIPYINFQSIEWNHVLHPSTLMVPPNQGRQHTTELGEY